MKIHTTKSKTLITEAKCGLTETKIHAAKSSV